MSNKIIMELVRNGNKPLFGREIARILKKNQKTVQAALHKYEERGILSKEIYGRNYLYTINTNDANSLRGIIGAENERTEEFLQKEFEIKELTSDLRKMTDEPILIFGSYAKEYKTKESDIDILVLDKRIDTKNIEHKYTKKIHLITMNKKEFLSGLRKKESFCQEVIDKHIIIQGYDFFAKRWLETHG